MSYFIYLDSKTKEEVSEEATNSEARKNSY